MDFEKKLTRLEDIVQRMERGDLSLDDSLKFFEEGVKLSRECNAQLAQAEQTVKVLLSIDGNGQAVTEDFRIEE